AAGKEATARDTLKDGIAMMPDSAELHHSLGLSYARQQQSADALRELERAVALVPDQSQYVYVYAVGLNSFGRTQDAIRTLERAAQRWPRQRDVQMALATMYRDAGRRDAARNVAKRYADAFPDDTEVQALVRSLKCGLGGVSIPTGCCPNGHAQVRATRAKEPSMNEKSASVHWEGRGKEGRGKISTETG